MTRKGQRDVFGRAGIEEPKQDPLTFGHADGLPVAEHSVVEGRRRVHHLQTVVGWRTCADILHADPGALPVVRCKQHFLIVAAWIVRRVDDQEPVHSGI